MSYACICLCACVFFLLCPVNCIESLYFFSLIQDYIIFICSLHFIAVILGFEQNFTVPEDVGSFEACFRIFNPPDDQELTFLIDLVVDTIEGTAGEKLHCSSLI